MHPNSAPPCPVDKPALTSSRRNRCRPTLEQCEGRTLLTTFTVTALTDSGAGRGTSGDLRYCIARADADGQRDTINFAVTGTIQLGSPLPMLVNARGITIDGPGVGSLTVRGGGASASFTMLRVQLGATAAISDLTFADGSAPQAGGAIFNQGKLTITGAAFTGNSARRNGGAINNVGRLTIADSTFIGNSARETGGGVSGNTSLGNGGAINNSGILTIADSTIVGNSAGTAGGGIDSIFNNVKITNTTIAGNSADVFGGGISLNGPTDFSSRGGTLTLINSTFNDNRAGRTADTGYGGAIGANDSDLKIDGTAFTGNVSGRRAGGVGVNGGVLAVSNSTFSGNTTGGDGGGLSINGGISITGRGKTGGSTLSVDQSTFVGNSAGGRGGAIESTSTTGKVTGAILSANSADSSGGGISLDFDPSFNKTHGSLTLTDSTLNGNTAGRSGGGINNFDQLTLRNATVTANLAGEAGGGIFNAKSLTIRQSTITENRPDNLAGTT